MMKTTPKTLAVTAALAASLLVLSGCAGDSTPPPSDPVETETTDSTEVDESAFELLPESVQSAGVLTLGVSPNFPPGNFEEDNGELNGSEVQFARALAPHLGVEVEHVITNFAGLLTGLQADRFDVILSGMSDTLEREEQVTFVNYLEVGANFLVLADNPDGIQGPADLCGLTGGAPQGTSYIELLGELSDEHCAGQEPITVQTFTSGSDVVTAVGANRIDFSLASSLSNAYTAQLSEGSLTSVGEPINPQLTGFVVPLGEDELVEALAAAVQAMMDSGELTEIMREWNIEDALLDEVQINGATF